MPLFTSRRRQPGLPPDISAVVDRVHPLASLPLTMTAGQAAQVAFPVAQQLRANMRLFLVLAGDGADTQGRSGEWQFHFVYPDERLESIITVCGATSSPVPGTGAVREEITPWPAPGSPQEAMLLHQGTTAKLIIEEQWADRLERLPGLPESFIDSSSAMAAVAALGVDLQLGGDRTKMKGRTPPGRQPVWEIIDGLAIYHTPFA